MRRILFVSVFALIMGATLLAPVPATAGACSDQEILGFDPNTPITGSARICENRKGVRGRMWVDNLVPGNAYTVWWGYIDDPSQCAEPGMCSPDDFGGDNPPIVFGRFDSTVANGKGQYSFYDFWGGMRMSEGSQVWLIVIGHGPLEMNDGRRRARQTLTPEDPAAGVPHMGNTVDGLLGVPAGVAIFAVE